ncbi:MAG: ribosome assembly cofactor RimP [Muribaculaceae bacterium]|nr:ribosome assembly cofactor RimP [Muribaculaceae bacterium]
MIDKQKLTDTVMQAIDGTDTFLVDVRVSPANEIVVEIDSPEGVDIDTCADITRRIEEAFDRDVEDYELEVGSAGLTSPMRVRGQFLKNIGNPVEVLTRDGRKLHGTLTAVNDDASQFTVATDVKAKEPGAKRPVVRTEEQTFNTADVKYCVYEIKF